MSAGTVDPAAPNEVVGTMPSGTEEDARAAVAAAHEAWASWSLPCRCYPEGGAQQAPRWGS